MAVHEWNLDWLWASIGVSERGPVILLDLSRNELNVPLDTVCLVQAW